MIIPLFVRVHDERAGAGKYQPHGYCEWAENERKIRSFAIRFD